MVEDDLPAFGALAPDERKDAVILLCFAFFGALEMKLSGDYGELGLAARAGKQANGEVVERQRTHLFAVAVSHLISLTDGLKSLAQSEADEGGVGRVFVSLHEAGDVSAVPCVSLRGDDRTDGGFVGDRCGGISGGLGAG